MPRDRRPDRRGCLARQRKKSLGGQAVQLGITWKPTPDGVFTRFHISDIWLDDDRHATRRANPNRDAQGLHPQPLDARLGRCRRVWQVRPRHRDRDPVRRHGRHPLRRFQERQPGAGECGREHPEACRRRHSAPRTWPPTAPSSTSRRHPETPRWAAAASRSASRRTSSSKASAPRESSASVPRLARCARAAGGIPRRRQPGPEDRFPTPAIFPKY